MEDRCLWTKEVDHACHQCPMEREKLAISRVFMLKTMDKVKKKGWQSKLIELSNGEYACATVMPSKKNIFGNWTEKRMCGDYHPVNRKTKLDRYPMPIPKELFDVIGFSRVFNTLDVRSGYHQLPLLMGDQMKTTFGWGLDRGQVAWRLWSRGGSRLARGCLPHLIFWYNCWGSDIGLGWWDWSTSSYCGYMGGSSHTV